MKLCWHSSCVMQNFFRFDEILKLKLINFSLYQPSTIGWETRPSKILPAPGQAAPNLCLRQRKNPKRRRILGNLWKTQLQRTNKIEVYRRILNEVEHSTLRPSTEPKALNISPASLSPSKKTPPATNIYQAIWSTIRDPQLSSVTVPREAVLPPQIFPPRPHLLCKAQVLML